MIRRTDEIHAAAFQQFKAVFSILDQRSLIPMTLLLRIYPKSSNLGGVRIHVCDLVYT